jgi:hypothetical protein
LEGNNTMKSEIAGITRANEGMQGISWNILGQTYVPKHVTEHSFSWHATFPPDTFVPPHIHPDQDEAARRRRCSGFPRPAASTICSGAFTI